VGAVILGVRLERFARRGGASILPRRLVPAALLAAPIGAATWLVARAIDPEGRVGSIALVAVAGSAAAAAYLVGLRLLRIGPPVPQLLRRRSGRRRGAPADEDEPADVAAEP
jgi:hypothetical protein